MHKNLKNMIFKKFSLPVAMATASKLMKLVHISCKFFSVTFQCISMCNTSYGSLCNYLKPNRELFSISILEFAQMPKISFSTKNCEIYEDFGFFKSDIFFSECFF